MIFALCRATFHVKETAKKNFLRIVFRQGKFLSEARMAYLHGIMTVLYRQCSFYWSHLQLELEVSNYSESDLTENRTPDSLFQGKHGRENLFNYSIFLFKHIN